MTKKKIHYALDQNVGICGRLNETQFTTVIASLVTCKDCKKELKKRY